MLDKPLIWQRVGNKPVLLQKIIQQFLDFYPGQVRVIEEAVVNHDEDTLHRASHRLRGAAANFEANAVVQSAAAVETCGREGDWDTVQRKFEELTSNLAELREELVAFSSEAG